MNKPDIGAGYAARRVSQFVRGAHSLAITSRSLAELLGLPEDECALALEAMASLGLLRKDDPVEHDCLYCKDS